MTARKAAAVAIAQRAEPRRKKTATMTQKEPLSAERIERAALQLIEEEGMAAFSTRKLAATLGCEAMSIYHYFPSKGHLLDALVDRVMGDEMTVLTPGGRNWRHTLEKAAREWRALGLRRPHFFGYLAMHRLNTPRALDWLNGIIGVFTTLGVSEEFGVRIFRDLGFYLVGAILEETAGYARGHSTVAPVPDDVMAARYPYVEKAGQWFRHEHWEKTFELGLKAMLDAVERELRRR